MHAEVLPVLVQFQELLVQRQRGLVQVQVLVVSSLVTLAQPRMPAAHAAVTIPATQDLPPLQVV